MELGKRLSLKYLNKFPDIFLKEDIPSKEEINEIPSIQEKTSTKFLLKLKDMRLFMNKLKEYGIIYKKVIQNDNKQDDSLDIVNIVVTGKRDKILMDIIKNKI